SRGQEARSNFIEWIVLLNNKSAAIELRWQPVLKGQGAPYPAENTGTGSVRDDPAHRACCRSGAHGRPVMTVAKRLMQLVIGNPEEALGRAIAVVAEARIAQDRISEGDRDRRIGATHGVARRRALVFGSMQGVEVPVGR